MTEEKLSDVPTVWKRSIPGHPGDRYECVDCGKVCPFHDACFTPDGWRCIEHARVWFIPSDNMAFALTAAAVFACGALLGIAVTMAVMS